MRCLAIQLFWREANKPLSCAVDSGSHFFLFFPPSFPFDFIFVLARFVYIFWGGLILICISVYNICGNYYSILFTYIHHHLYYSSVNTNDYLNILSETRSFLPIYAVSGIFKAVRRNLK